MNDPQELRSSLFDSILLYFKAFVLSANWKCLIDYKRCKYVHFGSYHKVFKMTALLWNVDASRTLMLVI